MVYPALLTLMRTPRLPVVDWTDAPADLNGLVRFAERQNLVSARVSSHFKRSLHTSELCGSWLYTWKCIALHGMNNDNLKIKITDHCLRNLLTLRQNWLNEMKIGETFPYWISTKSALWATSTSPFDVLCNVVFFKIILDPNGRRSESINNLHRKHPASNSSKIYSVVCGVYEEARL
jgi:hypothetical protein